MEVCSALPKAQLSRSHGSEARRRTVLHSRASRRRRRIRDKALGSGALIAFRRLQPRASSRQRELFSERAMRVSLVTFNFNVLRDRTPSDVCPSAWPGGRLKTTRTEAPRRYRGPLRKPTERRALCPPRAAGWRRVSVCIPLVMVGAQSANTHAFASSRVRGRLHGTFGSAGGSEDP